MTGEWRVTIPEQDWRIYEMAGFGHKSGFGSRPAILVIDVQYRTVGDQRAPILESMQKYYRTSCGEAAWRSVGSIQRLLEAARESSVPVIYPHVAHKTSLDSGRTHEKIPSLMQIPDHGYDFVKEVEPAPGDLLLPKRHPSAFFGTALASYLIGMDRDTVILTGCTTSGCVRASAVDACSYNFHCAVVEECVYDRSETAHNVNLFDIQSKYGDVVPLDDALSYLRKLQGGVTIGAAG